MFKKIIWGGIFFIFLVSYSNYFCPSRVECQKIDPKKVKRLEWVDPLGREPTSFKQFQATRLLPAPLKVKTIRRISAKPIRIPKTTDSLVAVIVNSDLYGRIQTSIDQYVNDLVLDGYTVEVDLWSGGNYQDLRDSLKDKWEQSGLVGAVLVGNLPVAWCELNVGDPEEFPIDYYFMELDGTWLDSNDDGLLEDLYAGSGDLGPEIWVGRLAPSSLVWGNEVQLLENYFTKNHNYRIGNLSLPHRALTFVDDDWDYFDDCELSYAYGDVTVINDVTQTIAANYKQKLLENYEWIHLCAHSSCWAHTFLINYGPGGGSVYNYEIHALQPHALFYNLFACSNTRFMETNNLGNWYIFVDDYGLAAVGSAKSGSMLSFYDFYYPLGQGKSIGDAYKEWFEVQTQDGLEDWEKDWYFGNNVLGDPTLTIDVLSQVVQTFDSAQIQQGRGSSAWTPMQVTASEFSDGRPAMTADFSDNIQATYETGRNVRSNIYSSSYNGTSWSPAEAVEVRGYWDLHPSMATDSLGKAWVTYQSFRETGGSYWNFDIAVSYHTLGGWTSPTIITSGADYDVEPAITVDRQGKIWVVWKGWRTVDQNVNSNIFASFYDGDWSSRMSVTADLHDDCDPVVVADTSGRIWVAWSTNRNGNWDIYSIYYHEGSWSELIPVTTDPDDDLVPTMTRDASGNIWIAWHSWRDGNANIYASYNDGTGWSAPIQVTSDPNNDIMPSINADLSGQVALAWMSNRSGNWDVFASFYDGSSWSPFQQITHDLNNDYEPAFLFDQSGTPCVIWASDRDGDWNIYFASYQFCAPYLIYPENFSYINDNTPQFEWSAVYKSDEVTDYWSSSSSTITYTLQYSKDSIFLSDVITISDMPNNFYELPESLALGDSTYFWRVQAVKESGDSSGYQTPFTFTVDTETPGTPVLLYPADDTLICDTTPTFEWSYMILSFRSTTFKNEIILSAPVRFTLQYSPDSEFVSQVTTVDSLVDNFYTVPDGQALNPDTGYYWRVRTFDLAGNESDFQSDPFRFYLFIRGDVNNDGIIDVGDVIYLINYLFIGGSEPWPFQAGDVNSDYTIDTGDIIYLINYLFKDASPPQC